MTLSSNAALSLGWQTLCDVGLKNFSWQAVATQHHCTLSDVQRHQLTVDDVIIEAIQAYHLKRLELLEIEASTLHDHLFDMYCSRFENYAPNKILWKEIGENCHLTRKLLPKISQTFISELQARGYFFQSPWNEIALALMLMTHRTLWHKWHVCHDFDAFLATLDTKIHILTPLIESII